MALSGRSASVALLLSVILQSCSMVPVVIAPSATELLPEQFESAHPETTTSTNGAPDATLQKWWTSFGDSMLEALIDSADVANLDIRIAAARVLEVQQAHKITRAGQFPAILASSSGSRQNTPTNLGSTGQFSGNIPGFPDRFDATTYSPSLSLTYEIDVWARASAASRAALSAWIATQADYQAVRMGITAEVISAYFEIRDLETQEALTAEQLTLMEERLELTQDRYARGLAPSFEMYNVQQAFDETRTQAPLVKASLFDARSRLGVLLGSTVAGTKDLLHDAAQSTEAVWNEAEIPDELPSDLILARPDVVAGGARLEAARQTIGVRRAEQFPSFSLTSSGGTQSSVLGDLVQTSQRFWLFGGSLTAPVFNAGARKANVRAAWAVYEQAAASYEKAILTAFRDVSASLTFQDANRMRMRAARSSLAAADASYDNMTTRYMRGVGDYVSLIDARLNQIRAEIGLSAARRSSALSRLTLYRSVGGNWFD